jgi:two-component system LytT family response regulator
MSGLEYEVSSRSIMLRDGRQLRTTRLDRSDGWFPRSTLGLWCNLGAMSVHDSFQASRRGTPPAGLKSVRRTGHRVLQGSERRTGSMPLKTLIVDDEPIARKVLREELELIDDVEVIGEAADGVAALEKIDCEQPDLVLLDLQMPAMGGLDVVRQLKHAKHVPVIVIVTAYDQHALQAFDAGAIDYLLKPVGQERLTQAVERAKRVTGRQAIERIAQLQEIADLPAGPRNRRIVGKIGEEYFLLSAEEIYAFQAEGDLVWILTAKRKYLATQTLKELELRLKSSSFRRIHRNAFVNVDHVRKMSALSSQRWLITMNNDQEFVASKRQARTVRELLTW